MDPCSNVQSFCLRLPPITKTLNKTLIFVLSRAFLRRVLICNHARNSKRWWYFLTWTQNQRSTCSVMITFDRYHSKSTFLLRHHRHHSIPVLQGMRKWNRWSDVKRYAEPEKEFGKEKNAGCSRRVVLGLNGRNLTLKWELKLKNHELILFESKSLNSAAGCGAPCMCVNLDGWNPKWLWTPGIPSLKFHCACW